MTVLAFYELTIGILCVWRITHLLQAEDGPWLIAVRLRLWAGDGFWAELLDCFYCLSLWIALLPAILLGGSLWQSVLLWPALSAGAIFIERILESLPATPAEPAVEEKEMPHGMLQQAQATAVYDSSIQRLPPRK